jgi:uncharacterized RmlC-like cupin family protein
MIYVTHVYDLNRQFVGSCYRSWRYAAARIFASSGDFIYIKPDVSHEAFNMSETEPVVAFVTRSSAAEWDNIIPCDRNRAAD